MTFVSKGIKMARSYNNWFHKPPRWPEWDEYMSKWFGATVKRLSRFHVAVVQADGSTSIWSFRKITKFVMDTEVFIIKTEALLDRIQAETEKRARRKALRDRSPAERKARLQNQWREASQRYRDKRRRCLQEK